MLIFATNLQVMTWPLFPRNYSQGTKRKTNKKKAYFLIFPISFLLFRVAEDLLSSAQKHLTRDRVRSIYT